MAKRKLSTILRLKEGDYIRAVMPESAAGPGWANTPLYVIVRDGNGKLREECLQPREQPRDVMLLFGIVEKVQAAMLSILEAALFRERR